MINVKAASTGLKLRDPEISSLRFGDAFGLNLPANWLKPVPIT
jgi:hypothetical protein